MADTNFEMDNFSLDDIEDLPEFGQWPTGAYHIQLIKGWETKKVNDKPVIEVAMTLKDIVDLEDSNLTVEKDVITGEEITESRPKAGDVCSVLFFMGTETGKGFFKAYSLAFAKKLGTKDFSQLKTASVGMEMVVVLVRSRRKDDPSKMQISIKAVHFV